MPFFLSNFADKLYLKRMAAECSPQLFAKLALFRFRHSRSPCNFNFRGRDMHGALNLENLHYFNGMQLNTYTDPTWYCNKKYENTAFKMQEILLETQKFKIFSGGSYPRTPNVHVLFFQKMTMFLGPLTSRQIKYFFHIYRP